MSIEFNDQDCQRLKLFSIQQPHDCRWTAVLQLLRQMVLKVFANFELITMLWKSVVVSLGHNVHQLEALGSFWEFG